PLRCEEDLESVAGDRRSRIRSRAIELADVDRQAEGAVRGSRRCPEVPVAAAARAVADEIQRGQPARFILEQRRAVVETWRVHEAAEIDRRLPSEIVSLVPSE